jgi:hypothetical protein
MSVISIDNFLEPEDLIKYQNYVLCSGLTQKIKEDYELTSDFWNKYGDKLNQNLKDLSNFSGLYPYVTITNSNVPVFKHTDSKFKNEKFKILIYLNNVHNGGTIFYTEETISIINKENRLVVFDIDIPHESQKFSKDHKKIAIGFRLKKFFIN